ncbi:hypothetical protein QJS10_CPA01g01450 [Acorus calamus]|uniref:Uncharacterized protein n=1 Tax=Acorus calamus TaxID=4465 RepID=A0AAV9FL02_ACOCL|nr:hypothetical protein QJS10_CPA01g01450 [Acorus calamus]
MEDRNKRRIDGVIDGGRRKRKRPRSADSERDRRLPVAVAAAEEDDVEEFFAILRRMREAARVIGAERRAAAEAEERRPICFREEDFEVVSDAGGKVTAVAEEATATATAAVGRPDLNVEPGPVTED